MYCIWMFYVCCDNIYIIKLHYEGNNSPNISERLWTVEAMIMIMVINTGLSSDTPTWFRHHDV